MAIQTFIITSVPNPEGAGAIYQVDGQNKPVLNLVRGGVYTFIQSAASNTNHPIAFKDDTGAAYTVGVVSTGVPGQTGAQTVFTVAANAPASLRYYCVTHGNNMGNTIVVTGNVSGIQTINIGNIVNDGLGDDLRTAFQKVNANFTELNASLTVTAKNIGISGEGIFAQKIGTELQFKNIVGGTKITLDAFDNRIVINNTQTDSFENITTQSGTIAASNHTNITIQGGNDVAVTASGSIITVDTLLDLNQILTVYDFGPINPPYTSVVQFLSSATNIDFGTITTPSGLEIDLGPI